MSLIDDAFFLLGDSRSGDDDKIGIAGFVGDVRIRESMERTQEAPDIALEDGSFAHDTLIQKPRLFTLEGEVGDMKINDKPTLEKLKSDVADFAVNEVFGKALTNFQRAIPLPVRTAYSAFTATPPEDVFIEQESFISHINAIFASRGLIEIEVMNKEYKDIAILSFNVSRDNETNKLSYSMQCKQLQFVKIITKEINKYSQNPKSSSAKSSEDKGDQQGVTAQKSLLGAIIS